MICELSHNELFSLVNKQIGNFWGFQLDEIQKNCVVEAINRMEKNFERLNLARYSVDGEARFSVGHSVQYSVFLYMLSNELYRNKFEDAAGYVYYLNKIMHANDWFYAIDLPTYWCAEHPLKSVLGRAKYGDYFFFYQGITVGGNRKGKEIFYPTIGNNVLMYADSKILGNAHIGDNVIVSANCTIKDEDVPDNCIVFGESPNLIIKHKTCEEIKKMTEHIWKWEETK